MKLENKGIFAPFTIITCIITGVGFSLLGSLIAVNLNVIKSLYIEGSKYDYVVGKVLADVGSDGDYLEEKGFSFGKLNEMAQEVATALDVDINEVKLLMGTRPS